MELLQKFIFEKMNYFIFLSLAISIAVGNPNTDDLPLFDYESYDYESNGIVTPLIGGFSEFALIDSVQWYSK